jgi:hypothetical protein
MKGDFTRNTFDPAKQFTRVLMQQGRVQLDADWNEQGAILLHYIQAFAADLIGPYAGPQANLGFGISLVTSDDGTITDLQIGNGRYYVDGRLCENPIPATYFEQANYPFDKTKDRLPGLPFLVYLDVWERLITAVEDDTIREVALGEADTAVRAQVVWQVKVTSETADGTDIPDNPEEGGWRAWVEQQWEGGWQNQWQPRNRGQLKARAKDAGARSDEACITPPDARYRGAENQLYRVEIHDGGTAAGGATWKWSRDNGSVIFPIRRLDGKVAKVEGLGGDGRAGLQPGDWVEVMDDRYVLRGEPGSLLTVQAVDPMAMTVTLSGAPGVAYDGKSTTHPLLRRWDSRGPIKIEEGKATPLEDGIEIEFQALKNATEKHTYRTGDYWLIPARTATGDLEWPGPAGEPESLPPHGVEHHYAPLAIISNGIPQDCRRMFEYLGQLEDLTAPIAPG